MTTPDEFYRFITIKIGKHDEAPVVDLTSSNVYEAIAVLSAAVEGLEQFLPPAVFVAAGEFLMLGVGGEEENEPHG